MWNLPVSVKIDNKEAVIRNNCDYRVILDVITALNDEELEIQYRFECALRIFYENVEEITNIKKAIKEMLKIINLGEDVKEENKPQIMNWEHDFNLLAAPVSRVLGYSVRNCNNYTHWYDFIGAYMEIGDCAFSNIISIRNKRLKGKKLEKWEQEFYRENKKIIDLPHKLTAEEEEFLNSE